jgi:hypothetical protein
MPDRSDVGASSDGGYRSRSRYRAPYRGRPGRLDQPTHFGESGFPVAPARKRAMARVVRRVLAG